MDWTASDELIDCAANGYGIQRELSRPKDSKSLGRGFEPRPPYQVKPQVRASFFGFWLWPFRSIRPFCTQVVCSLLVQTATQVPASKHALNCGVGPLGRVAQASRDSPLYTP